MMYDDSFVQSNSKSFFQFRITALFSRSIIYSFLFVLVILLLYSVYHQWILNKTIKKQGVLGKVSTVKNYTHFYTQSPIFRGLKVMG